MRHDISTRWVLYGSTCVFFDRLSRAYLEVFPTSTGVIEELRHAPYLFWNIQNTEKHLADPQFRSPLLCPFNQDIPDIFLRTLFMFRHTICQSSQDKIYALVNASRLNRLKFSFPIDYSLDFKDLYIEVARSCLRENLTDLLICATVTETAESRQRCELPSWVPDWRYPQSDLAPGLQQVVLAFEKACVSPGVLRDDSPGLSYLTGSGMVDSDFTQFADAGWLRLRSPNPHRCAVALYTLPGRLVLTRHLISLFGTIDHHRLSRDCSN